MTDTVLDVRNLQVQFQTDEKRFNAVEGIDFQLKRGQTLGIVGESGSGKSVTALAIMGLVPNPGKVSGGEIYFRASDDGSEPGESIKTESRPKAVIPGGANFHDFPGTDEFPQPGLYLWVSAN
jgi:peptide/nickel transport system ATP-binding protein